MERLLSNRITSFGTNCCITLILNWTFCFFVFLNSAVLNHHRSFYLFTSDSVFEDEGIETPCPAAQLAADVDKPNPAESAEAGGDDGERGETEMHSGTGEDLLAYPAFAFSFPLFFFCLLSLFGPIKVSVLDFLTVIKQVTTQTTLSLSRVTCPLPRSEQRVSR